MQPRLMLRAALFALLSVVVVGAAGAATIDAELQQEMNRKGDGESIRVLMLFDQPYEMSAAARQDLDQLAPDVRRRTVLRTYREHAQTLMQPALATLASVRAEHVKMLYLAGAISFRADRSMIETLAARDASDATLVWDKPRDMRDLIDANRASADPQQEDGDRATVWNVSWINADDVWDTLGYTGAGVLVGHLDSGVWLNHTDLVNRIWHNPGEIPGNGIDDDANGYIDDTNGWDFGDLDNNPNDDNPSGGHGTHTAGTVCGDGSAGTSTGVAPGAMLLPCKVFDSAGSGTVGMSWEAHQYCAEMGARVMTMSLGVAADDLPVSILRSDRYNNNAIRDAGLALFNSAGNEHFTFNPPYEIGMTARSPAPWSALGVPHSSTSGVVAVGGTGYQNNSVYVASSQGPVTWQDVDPWNDYPYDPGNGLTKPDIAAPGTNVNSTVRPSGYSGNSWSGTSMACPHIAGVAALMLEKNPSLSPAGLDSILEQSAVDLGTPGKDNVFGSGIVDALAAVNATPLTQTANLVQTDVLPDPTGDGVLDPGETSPIAFTLQNVSPAVAATGIQASLAVRPNAYVTVTDASAAFPDIAEGGGTGDNVADPFQLSVAAGAPQGFEFTMLLTVTCDGGFNHTWDITGFAGLPDFLTHDIGGVHGTVTDQGIIGYMSDDQTEGSGFGASGEGSALFLGSFWSGSTSLNVCNRDYSGQGVGTETYEWVTRLDPNGRMRDLGATDSDQTFQAAFTDGGAESPIGIECEQTSYAWADSPNSEFVIMEYHMMRTGTTVLGDYWAGVFCDWDVSAADLGNVDLDRHAMWLYDPAGGPYFGLALLGDAPPQAVNFIHNPTYVYPNAAIDDGWKLRFMRGLVTINEASPQDDWSMCCSAGPFDFGVDQEFTVAFAMVYGETLEDFLASVDAAKAVYDGPTPVTEELPVKMFRLAEAVPNPFNPQTTLKYEVARPGPVTLAIYDVGGKLVRTLVAGESRPVGVHEAVWDGSDDSGRQAPSGVYFAKYSAGDQVQTQKMTMVK